MTKPIIAIFGATGNQGNSTAHYILNNPSLSSKYTVRALSRSPSHPKISALASLGAETAFADLDDPSSLSTALKGTTYTFLVTTTPKNYSLSHDIEFTQAKNACTAAVEAGVEYIIFSSMSHPSALSQGALKNVLHFDVKAEIEGYIRSLPVKSAFFAPASFMQNLTAWMAPRPAQDGSGEFVMADMLPGDARVPYIDISQTGKWIGAILAEPEKYAGSFFAAADAVYTPDEIGEVMSKLTRKKVKHVQLADEVAKGFFPENGKEQLGEMFVFMREYGYFGAEQDGLVKWAQYQIGGNVTSLEEFLKREEFKLE